MNLSGMPARRRRPAIVVAFGCALAFGTTALMIPASATVAAAAPTWQLRWAPQASVDGLGAFEGVEDDRANSDPTHRPHIYVAGDDYRFDMNSHVRDFSTDRQRNEVKGMHTAGQNLTLLKGQTWRFTQSMYIPSSLQATTTFTHIMQMKMPGTGSLPILTVSLARVNGVQTIELHDYNDGTVVGRTNLVPLQDRWIDMDLEMTIGDRPDGRLRWVIRNGATTVVDVVRTGVDTWLGDRDRPKWGIYRSVKDSSGSLHDTYLLLTDMRAYQWSGTPAPPPANTFEAENATIHHGTVAANHAGFTGTGFVDYANETGSSVEWSIDSTYAGNAVLTLRYANGTTTDRPMDISVNGTVVARALAFNSTLAWDEWDTRTISATVRAGPNTIRATATTASGGPNVDNVQVQFPSDAPTSSVYQAEDGSIHDGTVDSDHAGFTGTGFVNLANEVGSYVELSGITAARAGTATLVVRYANGTTTSRPTDFSVNDGTPVRVNLPSTGSWTTWASTDVVVTLAAGANTVRATSVTAAGAPNLDSIEVQQ
jgi:alpha-galactosidase-like CBM13-containing protein/carbohydrate binding protein with CBM35 domain